jgi:hypothetical protein
MLPKRKRILLEKHNRLEPIDERKLKAMTKRNELDPIARSDVFAVGMPSEMISKTKRPFEIPAIDHDRPKAKLPAKLPGIMNYFD